MIDVMQYFGYGDWQLCSLACQVLWNYCASAADVHAALGEKETNKLICILEEFLGLFIFSIESYIKYGL